jgi:hypothetical protein
MFEYFFRYNITNGKNRTSVNKEEDNDEEDGVEEDSEVESESASIMDVDIPGMSYSRNVIILN